MNATDKAKKIQLLIIAGGALVLIGIIVFVVIKIKNDVSDSKQEYEWGFKADNEHIAQSKYINQVGEDVKGMEGDTKVTQEQIKALQMQMKALQETKNGGLKVPPPPLTQSRNMQSGFLQNLYEKYPAPMNNQPSQAMAQQEQRPLPILSPPPQPMMAPVAPVYMYEYEGGSISGGKVGESVEVNSSGKLEVGESAKKRVFVPSTTQVKVVLINGFNAPTLTNGKNVLSPVTVKAVENFMLPNGRRMDFKSCNFMGEASGKLSDNRADPRFTTMACIDKNDHAIEIPIRAYITDEYGSVGIEGTPVTLQNKLIEGALWASAIGGFANIASKQNMLISQNSLGTTSTQGGGVGEQFQSGLFGGIAKTGGRLEDFLFDNIKTLETVIQVKGRRNLVLHFTKGFYIYEDGSHDENIKIQEEIKK